MSSGDKVTKSQLFECNISLNGSIVSKSTTTLSNGDRWAFASPRPRPPVLTPTVGVIYRTRFNFGIYKVAHGVLLYTGNAQFAYTNYPQSTITKSSVGDYINRTIKARANLGSGPFNAANFLGEFHQTAAMISHRIGTISEAAKQLSNGNVKAFAQALGIAPLSRRQKARVRDSAPGRRLADNWLEYTYGWSPLVSDVYGAIQALQQGYAREGKTVTGRSGNSFSKQGQRDQNMATGPLASSATFRGTVYDSRLTTMQQLGLLNPYALAWELMPFSFVVDWFLPIGDALQALSAGVGLKNVTHSGIYEQRSTWMIGPVAWATYSNIYRLIDPVQVEDANGWKSNSMSVARVATSVSLLRQRFHR